MHFSILLGLIGLSSYVLLGLGSYLLFGSRRLPRYQAPQTTSPSRQKQFFPRFLDERYYEFSTLLGRPAATFRFNILGSELLHTCDPEKIKALLTTQVNDFSIESVRRAILISYRG